MAQGIDGNTLKVQGSRGHMNVATPKDKTDYSMAKQISAQRAQVRRDERMAEEREKQRRYDAMSKISEAGEMSPEFTRMYNESLANVYATAESGNSTSADITKAVNEANRISNLGGALGKRRVSTYAAEGENKAYTTMRFTEGLENINTNRTPDEQARFEMELINNESGFKANEKVAVEGLNAGLAKMQNNNPKLKVSIQDGLRVAATTGEVLEGDAKEAVATTIHVNNLEGSLRNDMERMGYEGTMEDFAFEKWKGGLDLKSVDVKTTNLPAPSKDDKKEKGFRASGNGWTDGIYKYTKGTDEGVIGADGGEEKRLPNNAKATKGDILTITLSKANKDSRIASIDFYDGDNELISGRLREIRQHPSGKKELVVITREGDTEVMPYEKNKEILLGEYNLSSGKINTMFEQEDESTSTDGGVMKLDLTKDVDESTLIKGNEYSIDGKLYIWDGKGLNEK